MFNLQRLAVSLKKRMYYLNNSTAECVQNLDNPSCIDAITREFWTRCAIGWLDCVQNHWVTLRSTQPFMLPRLMK